MEQIRLALQKRSGSSPEQGNYDSGEQLSLLFSEAEVFAAAGQPESEKTVVAAHTRQKRSGSIEEILPDHVPVEVIEHRLPEKERVCPVCDTGMQEIGKEIRRTLVIVPAQVKIREECYFSYSIHPFLFLSGSTLYWNVMYRYKLNQHVFPKQQSKSNATTKRGSPYLRKTLYQIISIYSKRSPNDEPVYKFPRQNACRGQTKFRVHDRCLQQVPAYLLREGQGVHGHS